MDSKLMEQLKQIDIVFEQVRLMQEKKDKETARRLRDVNYISNLRLKQEMATWSRISREESLEPKSEFQDDEFLIFNLDTVVGRYNYRKYKKMMKIKAFTWQCYICNSIVNNDITIDEHQKDSEHREKRLRLSEKVSEILTIKQREAAELDESINKDIDALINDAEENIDTSTEQKSTSRKRTFDDLQNDEITEKNEEISTTIADAFENECKKMK
ncbi:hypothetical protein PV326_006904 [Microctonus aethiopoides]|nr:hypothetical protein PV326_006904 [Microctonus aethiopoides]